MKIAVVGSTGWVGKSMVNLFPDAYQYTSHIGTKEEVNKCDVAFICVPTPFNGYDLNTSIVRNIIKWLKTPLIVIRSTVNPGDCDNWAKKYKKRIVFIPEYLGETPSHPLLDPKSHNFLIIGGEPNNRKEVIDIFTSVYNANTSIRQVTLLEAEVIKLAENRMIASKIITLHELYLICEKAGIDYYVIRDGVLRDDPRFNLWFSFIYKNKLGFNNSKCLKKDVPAFCAWAESIGYKPELTRTLVKLSSEYDLYENNKINTG